MEVYSRFKPDQIRLYRDHFEMYDLNKDGRISVVELKKVSRKLGYRLSDLQVQEIMHSRDADDNGFISFDEFLQAMPANDQISQEEHRTAEIRRKFLEFDIDGNGYVTADEAHEILAKELAFTPEQSLELLRRYDKNGDGKLDYEEFSRFYGKVKAKASQIRQMFHEFDTDKSGTISLAEAKRMLRKLKIPDDEVETLVDMYDRNKDGELEYEEFVGFLLHS